MIVYINRTPKNVYITLNGSNSNDGLGNQETVTHGEH